MWFYHYEQASNKMAILEAAGKWVYALVKRQCSPELVTKLDCNNVATHTCRKMAWHSYKQVVKKEKKTEKCFHCNRLDTGREIAQ